MIRVTVTRSGGIAGISQRWTVSVGDDDWELLCSRAGRDPVSRDRFVYRLVGGGRTVEIPESRLDERLRLLLSGRAEPRAEG